MEAIQILQNYLADNSAYSTEEIDLICSFFQEKKISKEESLFKKGHVFTKIVFVAEGILRSYIHDEDEEEIIKHFIRQHDFFSEIDSYEKEIPCAFNVSAITNCKLLILSKSDSEMLSENIPDWEIAMKGEAVKAMNSMIRNQEFLHKGEAIDKYRFFMKYFPELAQQLPLKHIASYLQITQSSLSRIRRQAW
jgi:CRP-like cAMP-binding protein